MTKTKEETNAKVNELLRCERERIPWTLRDVIRELNELEKDIKKKVDEKTGQSLVSNWERGIYQPSEHHLGMLIKIFHRTRDELGYPINIDHIPYWNIKEFKQNPFFTGRKNILMKIHEMLTEGQSSQAYLPLALTGLAGIGKTQIAIEYAYRHKHDYQTVILLHAEQPEVLSPEFAQIQEIVNLRVKHVDQKQAILAVKEWLENFTRWLLIFDNVEDLSIIGQFIPEHYHGHIILTTKAHSTIPFALPLEIPEMRPEISENIPKEAATLLLRRANVIELAATYTVATREQLVLATKISKMLGYLPLALDQAGAYIEEAQSSLGEYIQWYQKKRKEMLHRRGKGIGYPRSVATTLSLSIEKVAQTNSIAVELLHLFAFLAPDAIPEELVTESAPIFISQLATIGDNPFVLPDATATLGNYSLVHRNVDIKTYRVHRLVQAVVQDEMNKQTQKAWAELAVQIINCVFPEVEDELNWRRCQRYLPHAQVCEKLIKKWCITSEAAARLLHQMGVYYRARAQYAQAESRIQQAQIIYGQLLGEENAQVAKCLDDLAEVYREQDLYDQSEPLYQKALEILKAISFEESVQFADVLNNLGMQYDAQGKFEEAEALFQQATVIFQEIPGPPHVHLTYCLNNLANLYTGRGLLRKAEPLYHQAVTIGEKILGTEHHDVAVWYHNLATLKNFQYKYDESEEWFQKALAIYDKTLGKEHPLIATSLNNLGALYIDQGRYDKAEHILELGLNIRKRLLGLTHDHVGKSYGNLAKLYREQGDYEKAEQYHKDAIEILSGKFGEKHPVVGLWISEYARWFHKQEKYEEAEKLYRQAIGIWENAGGLALAPPKAVEGANYFAMLLYEQGRYEEAHPILQQVLAIRITNLGKEHPVTIACDEIYRAVQQRLRKQSSTN